MVFAVRVRDEEAVTRRLDVKARGLLECLAAASGAVQEEDETPDDAGVVDPGGAVADRDLVGPRRREPRVRCSLKPAAAGDQRQGRGEERYSPRQVGCRFSKNALMPSCASQVIAFCDMTSPISP